MTAIHRARRAESERLEVGRRSRETEDEQLLEPVRDQGPAEEGVRDEQANVHRDLP
jgi:hypothetical protein